MPSLFFFFSNAGSFNMDFVNLERHSRDFVYEHKLNNIVSSMFDRHLIRGIFIYPNSSIQGPCLHVLLNYDQTPEG